VLVVGGGQAGLSIAARLAQLGVDALIVDREPRVGDNWRKRYHALTLHNQVHVNHLPYMPFPPNWPVYIPKDKSRTGSRPTSRRWSSTTGPRPSFRGATYDESEAAMDGAARARRRHEAHAAPAAHRARDRRQRNSRIFPEIRRCATSAARCCTRASTPTANPGAANAIVIGTGNSGHDIAQDLHSSGAKVTLVQRSPTLIVNIEPSAQLPYSLYDEGPPLEDCDLITMSVPLSLAWKSHQIFTERAKNLDQPLLDKLERIGFRLDFGEEGTGLAVQVPDARRRLLLQRRLLRT
jgi:putative flavoprotein involved in K+ transport